MPRRRRPVRPVRRSSFRTAPEPSAENVESGEAEPSFADEPAVNVPLPLGTGGPVETRPHWNARSQRVQGRRLEQLRRSSGETRGIARTATGTLPTFASGDVHGEIRQILLTTVALVALIIVLTFVLR